MSKSAAQAIADEVNAKMKSTAIVLGSDPALRVSFMETGVLAIDRLLGGGLPRGRMVEIYGDYSTLKSWIGLKAIAAAQKRREVCAIVDAENSFDPAWATELGVDTKSLIYLRPAHGEEAVDMTEALVREHDVALVVWDSIAATEPQDSQNKRMAGESVQPARLAALMSHGLRKINTANSNTAILFINQTRLNIGITYGSPEAIPGGKAMGFYASYRLSMKKAGLVKEDVTVFEGGKKATAKRKVAQKIRVTVEKSKLSAPHRDTMLLWNYDIGGLDEEDYLLGIGMEMGLISTNGKGSWTFGKKTIRCAAANVTTILREQPELLDDVRRELGLPGKPAQGKRRVIRRKR